jgi:hypothetical protein
MAAARFALIVGLLWAVGAAGAVVSPTAPPELVLNEVQSAAFRAWFVRIVEEQVQQGPSPRWPHKDCAGLVRFAVNEALSSHDPAWLQASGVPNRYLPPELNLTPEQARLHNSWKQTGSSERTPFVTAIELIQENCSFVSKDVNQALPGDLLFFDQGEDQHLMIWMGSFIAYHRGSATQKDNGLRSVGLDQLLHWKDARWQPRNENPNFIGIFRFSFLSR